MVKAHVIPESFLKRASEAAFMECDGELRPKRSWIGWYDTNLVSAEGEKVFQPFDDAGARFFHGQGLTYRSRRATDTLQLRQSGLVAGEVLHFDEVDTRKLRLFGLSLLWRIAASDLEPFQAIQVREARLRQLGAKLLLADAGDPHWFPVYYSVFDDAQELPKMAPHEVSIGGGRFVRIFLDGVICYASLTARNVASSKLSRVLGGSSDFLNIPIVPSAASVHLAYAQSTATETFERFGDPWTRARSRA
jgi:hypothetical protein